MFYSAKHLPIIVIERKISQNRHNFVSWCHLINLSQHHTDIVFIKCGSTATSTLQSRFFSIQPISCTIYRKIWSEGSSWCDDVIYLIKNGMHILNCTPTSDRHFTWVHLLHNAKEHHTLYSSNWTLLPEIKKNEHFSHTALGANFTLSSSLYFLRDCSLPHFYSRAKHMWYYSEFLVIFFTSVPHVQF